LGSFRRFAVDGLKLDRSFLDPTVSSRRAAAVIRSGITLARDLGIALIAEGVESLDQVALLQAMGCEDAQGYLFSRPVTPDVLFELLQAPNLQAA
jgi:EAL domain-containing protein (putative c-di-GMP-specific phosphodiesterase class I)